MRHIFRPRRPRNRQLSLIGRSLLASVALIVSCSLPFTRPEGGQRIFDEPQEAMMALLGATEARDLESVRDILGHKYTSALVGEPWKKDQEGNQQVVALAQERLVYDELPDGSVEVLLGDEQWPFPMKIVQHRHSWYFDTQAGMEEIRNRRIGRNELLAIALLEAYADAQIEYASVDRNGNDLLEYAQRLLSEPGRYDGLYWAIEEGESESPFAHLASQHEAYVESLGPGDAFYGYHYRVLTAQGSYPPGGAYSYVNDGRMVTGFALVASPEAYAQSGVMTFMTSHHGRVYQKDLGQNSPSIDTFAPDETWTVVE
jgi:hypothetical protein